MKDKVIKMLIENIGKPLSGQTIAHSLGVSRNAVWKAVNELKKSGYDISSTTNTGYVLRKVDQISLPMIEQFLKTKANVIVLDTVDSSNNYAKVNLSGDWDVVVAKTQTAGKGRLGRSFFSPREGVYMSIVLRESLIVSADNGVPRKDSVAVTIASSVAVTRAIEIVTGLKTEIKWVNDIFVGGKKVCGILTEGSVDLETGTIESAVVGIGINCGEINFPEGIDKIATTIGSVDKNRLIAEVINQMREVFCTATASRVSENGHIADKERNSVCNQYHPERSAATEIMNEYRAKSMLLGQMIEVVGRGFCGKAVAIDDKGQLVIELENGQITLNSGEVSVKLV